MSNIGKMIRLRRLFNPDTNRTLIVPLDDALLAGPEGGLRNIKRKFFEILEGGADAVMGFQGFFKECYPHLGQVSGILNLTASTTRGIHTRKVLIGTVEQALRLGMDAVGVHVNISSKYEHEMLKILGDISNECERLGMPLMGLMYPRTENEDGSDNNYYSLLNESPDKYTELVRHCVKVGVELGVDIIKTQYTGSSESFQSVVDVAAGIPVVIAGGPLINTLNMLEKASGAILGGASGLSFGRNVFNRSNSTAYVTALRHIVHDNATVEEAMRLTGLEV